MNKPLILIFLVALTLNRKADPIEASQLESFLSVNVERNIGFFGKSVSEEFQNDLSKKLAGMITFRQLKSSSDKLPDDGIWVYPIGTADFRNEHNKIWSQSEFNLDKLINFLDPLVNGKTERVEGKYFEGWVKNKLTYGSKYLVMLFETNPNKRHLAYRSLSAIPAFHDLFHFGFCNSDIDVVEKIIKREKYPSVIILSLAKKKDEEEPSVSGYPYDGPIVYSHMYQWFERFTLTKEQNERGKPEDPNQAQDDSQKMPEFSDQIFINDGTNNASILDNCKSVNCLIAFENFWRDDETQLKSTIETLKKVQKNYSQQGLKVLLLNGGCHDYLFPELNIQFEGLPSVIFYNESTLEFSPLMAKFDVKEILIFTRKIRTKAIKPQKFQSPLKLRNVNCEEERQKWVERRNKSQKKSEEDDEIMKEVMEEIKKKEDERKFVKDKRKKKHSSEL